MGLRNLPLLVLAVLGTLWSGTASFAQAPPAVPALPDTERRTSYSLSASTCPACSVGFALYGDSTDYGAWIEVWIVTGSGTSTVATQLTAVTDFTLSSATGSLATIPRPITDATITLSTARTGTLQIVGARRPRRTAQFAENRGVAARDLNQALTDIIASNRETWDRTKDVAARALLAAPGDTIGLLPNAAVRAGGILAFDGSGNPTIAAAGSSGTANVVGPNVSVVGHIATFGNTAGTLLLDGGLVGAGDFVGPGSSTVNHAVTFAGATGKIGKDSGLTLTPSTGTITVTNAKTLTIDNSLELAGTDGTVMTFPTTSATLARTDAANTFTGHQTIEGVTTTGATGTGKLVFDTAPTLGAITVTTVNGLQIPLTASTLAIVGGKTFTASNTLTLAGTDGKTLTISNSGTLAGGDAFTLAIAAGKTLTASSSLTLAGVDAKTLTVNNSGTIAGGDAFTLAIAAGKTLTASNSLTFTGTDATSFAFPSTSDTVTGIAATQTLTNKTLTAPTINGGTAQALTNLGIRSSGGGAFDMVIANSETLTAQRALTVTLNNAARLLSLSGDLTTSAAFTTSGGNAITLTTTGSTGVTLPTSGTLATINTAQTISGANVFSATQQFTDIKLSSGKIYPTSDGTTALQITKADGSTRIVNFDTTNARVGINKTAGAFDLDVNGAANIGGALTFGTATITGLTVNNSPSATNDYLLYYSASAGAIRSCTVGSCAAAATAGVSSLNGLTGGLSIAQGAGITVSAAGSSVTVTNAGVTSFAGNTGAFTTSSGITNSTNDIRVDGALGMRNRVLNPSGQVQQGTAGSVSDGGYLSFDQWQALTQTGAVADARLNLAENGSPYMMRLTQSQASAQRMGFIQWIESANCLDLRGQTVTFSLRARLSSAPHLRMAIVEWTGTADTITKDIVNDWTSSTYTTGNFFTTTSTTVSGVSASLTGADSGAFATLSLTATIGSSMNNLAVFVWSEGTMAQNATLDIARVQLEIGSSATALAFREYGQELLMAKRYYEVMSFSSNAIISGQAINTTDTYGYLPFTVVKRVAPTITISGSWLAWTAGAGNGGGTISSDSASTTGARIFITGGAGLVAGNASNIFANGSNSITANSRL